jgi:hypothetical protein
MRIASPLRWCATSKQALLRQNDVKWYEDNGKFEIVAKETVTKFSDRSGIAVRMSRPTAETVTRSSKTQVSIYGNVGNN